MSTSVYDIIVVGGGISGVGVALEASKIGYKTLLIDKQEVLQAASANSLRIIHGGFRYLQSLSLLRVVESIQAQHELLHKYPEYIEKLACVLSLNKTGLKSRIPLSLAIFIYSLLQKFYTGHVFENKILAPNKIDEEVRFLKDQTKYGALFWYDAAISNLEKFHQSLRNELSLSNVEILEFSKVSEVYKDQEILHLNCNINNEERVFSAKSIINCSGAWLEKIKINIPGYKKQQHKWCKAFNLILNKKIEQKFAVGIESKINGTKNSRLYFIVPRGDQTIIGTEYKLLENFNELTTLNIKDKEGFLENLNKAVPKLNLSVSDILDTEEGILPYKEYKNGEFKLIAQSKIYKFDNYIEVLSTKYTTFLMQAKKIIKLLPIVK